MIIGLGLAWLGRLRVFFRRSSRLALSRDEALPRLDATPAIESRERRSVIPPTGPQSTRPAREEWPINREPDRARPPEATRLCVYSLPEITSPVYLWCDEIAAPRHGGQSSQWKYRFRTESEWTGPKPFVPIGSACQVVWGAETPARAASESSAPWVDAAKAAAIALDDRRESTEAPADRRVLVIVVGAGQVERHVFRLTPGPSWLRGVVREEVRIDRVELEASSPWERIDLGASPFDGLRIVLAAPSLHDRLPLSTMPGITTPEQLYVAFAKAWIRRGGVDSPAFACDFGLGYPRERWGSCVPHRSNIRFVTRNLRRVYRLAGGQFADFSVDFRIDQRHRDGSTDQRLQIPPNRLTGQRDRLLSLELDACPATGSSRFILRSEPRHPSDATIPPIVFWPIVDPSASLEDRPVTAAVPVSVCLAVDASSTTGTWAALAPFIARIRQLGRLRRLQIVWSLPDRSHTTQGWSSLQLEAEHEPFGIDPPAPDSPDSIICRGLSGGLREAFLTDESTNDTRPGSVVVVIVDRHYDPGRDPAFQSIESRWAWSVRLRRSLGGQFSLLAYRLGQLDDPLTTVLEHLVILGGQAKSRRGLLSAWEEGGPGDREAIEIELAAIAAVAERFARATGPGGGDATPLRVIAIEDEDEVSVDVATRGETS